MRAVLLGWVALLACGEGPPDEAAQVRMYCEAVAAHPRKASVGGGGPLGGLAGGGEQQRLMAIVTDVRARFEAAGVPAQDNLLARLSTVAPEERSRTLREIVSKAGLGSVCQAALAEL